MDFNTLTTTLTNFKAAFTAGYALLAPSVNYLIYTLLGIELVLIGCFWALNGGEKLGAVIKQILFILFWLMLIANFQDWAQAFVNSLINAGLIAGGKGGQYALLLDPSRIAGYGLDATIPLVNKLNGIRFDIVDAIVIGLAYILIMLAFLIIAIQVVLTQLEFYLILTLSSILLPWGLLKPTKFIAEKAIGAIISAGIKLMVLSFIIAIADNVLSNIAFAGADIQFNELWSVFLTAATIAFLAWNAPGMAAGLISGSPSLSAGVMAQNMVAGAMVAGMGAQTISGGMKAAASGAGKATAGGIQMASAGKMGADLQKMAGGGKAAQLATGIKTAGTSLVQSTLGKATNSIKGAVNSNVQKGAQAGWKASGGNETPSMKNTNQQNASGGGSKTGGAAGMMAKAHHATPREASPSGGSIKPNL